MLRVRNADLIYQIDGTYQNIAMVSKGQATTSVENASYRTNRADVIVTGRTNPQIAVRSSVRCYCAARTDNGNGQFTFTFYTDNATTFTYYVFDVGVGGASGAKLILRNAAGDVIFDSSYNYMRVAGMIHFRSGEAVSQTLPSGREYALLMGAGGRATSSVLGPVGGSSGGVITYLRITNEAVGSGWINQNVAYAGAFTLTHRVAYDTDFPRTDHSQYYYGTTAVQYPIIDVTYY